jgi:hypothetical protein
MTRILFFTLFVIAAALGLAWLADRPGTISVEWLGYQIETSAFIGVVFLAIFASASRSRASTPCRGGLLQSGSATAPRRSAMRVSRSAPSRRNR